MLYSASVGGCSGRLDQVRRLRAMLVSRMPEV